MKEGLGLSIDIKIANKSKAQFVVYCPERLPSFFYKKCVKGTTDKSIFPPIFANQI